MPGSYQQRQQQEHEQKLKAIREQVASGKLVIRQMTKAERKRFPPHPRPEQGPRSRRG